MGVPMVRLKAFQIFRSLEDREVQLIAEYAKEEKIAKDKRIFEEGSLATNLYLLESGKVSLRMTADKVGKQLEIDVLRPGEMFGWSAVAEPYTFTAGAWALEDTTVITLSSDVLRDIFKKNCHIGYLVMKEVTSVISERLKMIRKRFVELLPECQKKKDDRCDECF